MEKLQKVLDILKSQTAKEVIKITTSPAENLFLSDSKFGGLPYLPKNASAPVDKKGRQLSFLAQINCEQLPENNIYPKTGILQFWFLNEDVYGVDFDNPTSNDTSRVVYYENVEDFYNPSELENIYKPYSDEDEESYSPVEGEFALSFEKTTQGITPSTYNFEEKFSKIWNEQNPEQKIESIWDLKDEETDYIYDFDDDGNANHQIGGYPFFTQSDPREYGNQDYSIVLLQIDSESKKEKGRDILWGDVGVANFFITPQQLENKDFSKVLYTWDCG